MERWREVWEEILRRRVEARAKPQSCDPAGLCRKAAQAWEEPSKRTVPGETAAVSRKHVYYRVGVSKRC